MLYVFEFLFSQKELQFQYLLSQGEWTTYRTRKKKSAPADAISPVNPKDQAGNSRQEKRDNRDSGGSGLSQSVEYNNRRSKSSFINGVCAKNSEIIWLEVKTTHPLH